MSTDDGIFRLCYSFLQIQEDLISIRHFAANGLVVALTSSGKVINFQFSELPTLQSGQIVEQDDLKALTLEKLIERMQRYLKQGISDSRRLMGYGMLWLMADVYGLDVVWEALLHPDAEMFQVKDLPNRVVVADFECLISGKEGRGTDFPKFDQNWKLICVEAVRHGLPLQF
eukprot:CCRYP_009314-RA/>CCRYP_009314-RA protein AED:0.04 eAED:0.04 QI:273/1/1/1/0/0/2/150/171